MMVPRRRYPSRAELTVRGSARRASSPLPYATWPRSGTCRTVTVLTAIKDLPRSQAAALAELLAEEAISVRWGAAVAFMRKGPGEPGMRRALRRAPGS